MNALNDYFTMESVQQIQIIDLRSQEDKLIVDCTIAVFMTAIKTTENNFLVGFDSADLIRFLELNLDMTGIQLTPLVHVLQTDRAIIPFAVIVSVCSALIVAALIAFCKIGTSKGKPKGELCSGWLLAVLRPTILGQWRKNSYAKNTLNSRLPHMLRMRNSH